MYVANLTESDQPHCLVTYCVYMLHTSQDTTSVRIVYSSQKHQKDAPAGDQQVVAEQIPSTSFECEGAAAIAEPGPAHGDVRRWATEPDRVYEQLRDDLTAGLFAPGEALVESALAERYSASRTPVRAAISRLVNDRLIEARPHSVTRVRDITAREIRQIYEIRQALEGFAAEAAAGMIERAKLERLLAFYDATPPVAAAGCSQEAIDQGVAPLHFLIAESLGNGRLTDLLCAESLPLVRMHALYWRLAHPRVDAMEKKRRAAALDEHRAIAEALLAGSGPEARELVVRHLQGACDHLIALMTTIDLDRSNAGSERRNPDRSATALDHMIPGLPGRRADVRP
ncbi:GntR family transcriptional regulator [Mycobacterium sp. CBMA247]|nr:GntR family transcriptional regulator [Mycolicibacterium sp. CBMA 329]MUL91532.1 GntR family transcriptional regulator [Mycolicibacterium sp. CBMA 331]MUM27313.1 GntR family transcriptional regulator [Mycolicibacterium sp. CBMA 295]MUM41178.1 GntR family transcriptional regulator [Mycolicibacterium sp. CBMA 247]MUM47487.1 GntR family transcriptional regulator [Mycolicibacterium sp. CBMA 294]